MATSLFLFIIGKSKNRFTNASNAIPSAYIKVVKSKNLSEGADGEAVLN